VLSALAATIDRHPWRVLVAALLVVAVAAPLGLRVRDHLKPRGFDVPGSGNEKARGLIERASGTDPANSVLAVVRLPAPFGTRRSQLVVRSVESRLGRDPAVALVLDTHTARNPSMVARDRRTTYLIAALKPLDDQAQEDAGKRLLAAFAGDRQVTLGGNPIANHEISKKIEDDLRRAELLAVPLIVLLSFFLFRGFVASLLAPVAGGATVIVSFFILRGLASVTSLSIYALNLVTGLSIGLSIDWSLLLLSRYREERASTDDLPLALRHALIPAGRTVFYSALTVAAALATLIVFPLRFLRSMGYGGIIAAAVAMLAALVLLPSLLRVLGPRIDALTLPRWRDPRRVAEPGSISKALGRVDVKRPVPIVTVVVMLLVAVATPALRVHWSTVDAASLPASTQAYQADAVVNRSGEFPPNSGTPFYLAVAAPPTAGSSVRALATRVGKLPGVRGVAPPVRLGTGAWRIDLVSGDPPLSGSAQAAVRAVRAVDSPYPFFVGGDAAAFRDERSAIGSHLPIAVALLAGATLLILFLFSGSIVAPLVSLAMTALTLAAAFGALVLIFQDGRLEGLLDYTGQNALDLTIPLVLAALVFAIVTDYGVFLLSRIREARLGGLTDREAIQGSVARVSRIVVSAAVLFAVSIGVFGTSSIVLLKILGVGTAVAVLVDSLFVRSMLLPASLALLGPRAWWAPRALRRLYERIGLREERASDSQAEREPRPPLEIHEPEG
jgi:putative drug exporter of the RND superfamily